MFQFLIEDRGDRASGSPLENQLARVWQYQLLDKTKLVTEDGEPVEIIYPGRANDDRGPDFRGAVVTMPWGLAQGDIELHVDAGGWREHGHDRDAVYNQVILHVVMWPSAGTTTNLENGRKVPVLALHKYLRLPTAHWSSLDSTNRPAVPCSNVSRRLTAAAIAGFLDRAGEERFLTKAGQFAADLTQVEAGQSLYQGIMGALGYARNKLPFVELARHVPLSALESIAQAGLIDAECLMQQQAWLLGVAGLLSSQGAAGWDGKRNEEPVISQLERLWVAYHYPRMMSPRDWNLGKVRPQNHPVRRLVALSYLILRYRSKGLLSSLMDSVGKVAVSHGCRTLEEALMVSTDGGGGNCFDLTSGWGFDSPALLGRQRAADIVVNVLLPFAFAFQSELKSKAMKLYRGYPRLVLNSVEKPMMTQLGLDTRLVDSACRQQGLLHLFQNWCTQGRCDDCQLARSQLETGYHVQV